MAAGRKPAPLEKKRLTGRAPGRDSGGRLLPAPRDVVALPMAEGVPEFPEILKDEGRGMWRRVWTAGAIWISPATDLDRVANACRLADDVHTARMRYRATTEPADARALVVLNKEFAAALSDLGFTPTARARLGVAEVRRVSALERLIQSRESGT